MPFIDNFSINGIANIAATRDLNVINSGQIKLRDFNTLLAQGDYNAAADLLNTFTAKEIASVSPASLGRVFDTFTADFLDQSTWPSPSTDPVLLFGDFLNTFASSIRGEDLVDFLSTLANEVSDVVFAGSSADLFWELRVIVATYIDPVVENLSAENVGDLIDAFLQTASPLFLETFIPKVTHIVSLEDVQHMAETLISKGWFVVLNDILEEFNFDPASDEFRFTMDEIFNGLSLPDNLEVKTGTEGDDVINASLETDGQIVWAFGGNDLVLTGSGNDLVYGGAGDDLIITGAGDDNIFGGEGFDRIYAGDGNDFIRDFSGTTFVDAGAGNDRIELGDWPDAFNPGNHIVYAGAGNDIVDINGGNIFVDLGAGNDGIRSFSATGVIYAQQGGNWIDISDGSHTVFTEGADDASIAIESLYASHIYMGSEDDSVDVQYGGYSTTDLNGLQDWIINFGTGEADLYFSMSNYRTDLDGVPEHDIYITAEGDWPNDQSWSTMFLTDIIHGVSIFIDATDGDDRITIRYGEIYYSDDPTSDVDYIVDVSTGADRDDITIENARFVNLDSGSGNDDIYVGYGIENLDFEINIHAGSGNDDVIFDDSVYQQNSEGYLSIDLGSGDDRLDSSLINGTTILDGGSGDDNIRHYQETGTTIIDGGAGNDEIRFDTWIDDDLTVRIDGGTGDDNIEVRGRVENADANVDVEIDGGAGDDTIIASSNSFFTGDFEIALNGGAGNDTIDASTWNGNTEISGGDGSDLLYGGNGEDLFIFNQGETGVDTIENFDVSQGDSLDLSGFDFFDLLAGLSGDGLQDALNEFIQTREEGGNTIVSVDLDGAGGADAIDIAILNGVLGLDVSTIVNTDDLP